MLVGPGSAVRAILIVLGVNIIIKMVIVGVVAFFVTRSIIGLGYVSSKNNSLKSILIISIGGALAFQLPFWLLNGVVGLIIGIVAFWLVVTFTLDAFFDVDYEKSYTFTGQIVGVSMLVWIIIGTVLYLLSQ